MERQEKKMETKTTVNKQNKTQKGTFEPVTYWSMRNSLQIQ